MWEIAGNEKSISIEAVMDTDLHILYQSFRVLPIVLSVPSFMGSDEHSKADSACFSYGELHVTVKVKTRKG